MDKNDVANVGEKVAVEVNGAFQNANLWGLNATKLSEIAQNLRERAKPFKNDGTKAGHAVSVMLLALAGEMDPAVPSDNPEEYSGYSGRKRGNDHAEHNSDGGSGPDDSGSWEF